MNALASFVLSLALFAFAAPAAAQDAIDVRDVRARATLGSGQTSAVYLTLANRGSTADRLSGVASEIARSVELHTTIHDQGIMKMRPLDGVDVPADANAVFAPGGDHIMLIGLDRPLAAGDRFTLTLTFDKAGAVEIEVPVVAHGDIHDSGHGAHGSHGSE